MSGSSLTPRLFSAPSLIHQPARNDFPHSPSEQHRDRNKETGHGTVLFPPSKTVGCPQLKCSSPKWSTTRKDLGMAWYWSTIRPKTGISPRGGTSCTRSLQRFRLQLRFFQSVLLPARSFTPPAAKRPSNSNRMRLNAEPGHSRLRALIQWHWRQRQYLKAPAALSVAVTGFVVLPGVPPEAPLLARSLAIPGEEQRSELPREPWQVVGKPARIRQQITSSSKRNASNNSIRSTGQSRRAWKVGDTR